MYDIFYYSVNLPKCQPPSCRQLDPYHDSAAERAAALFTIRLLRSLTLYVSHTLLSLVGTFGLFRLMQLFVGAHSVRPRNTVTIAFLSLLAMFKFVGALPEHPRHSTINACCDRNM